MNKWLNFKNTEKLIDDGLTAIFSTDENGNVWHEISNTLPKTEYVMVLDWCIVAKSSDPTTISPLDGSSIYETKSEDAALLDNITTFSIGDFVYYDNSREELIKVGRPDDMVKPVFNEETHIWEETATESEIYISKLRKEYREYKEMDSPSILREMELTDTSIVDEYISMMIKLRGLISNYNIGIITIYDIPTPSKALVDFKNRIRKIVA